MGFIYSIQICEISHQTFGPSHRKCPTCPTFFAYTALVQVMAWRRQATSHYQSQCRPRSLPPYGVTRPQWVNSLWPIYTIWWHRSGPTFGSSNSLLTDGTKLFHEPIKISYLKRKFHQNLLAWYFTWYGPLGTVLRKKQNPGSPNGLPMIDGWVVRLSSGWSVNNILRP